MKVHPLPGELVDFAKAAAAMKLVPAAKAQPAVQQHVASTLQVADYRLDVLTKGAPKPQPFTLAPLFPLGTVGLLYGPGGVGKSMQALDLSMAVAQRAVQPDDGNLNFACGPLGGTIPAEAGGATIFITLEDAQEEVHRRRFALDADMTCADAPVYVVPGIDIDGFEAALITPAETGRRVEHGWFVTGLENLLRNVAKDSGRPVRLLVLDPAGDFLDGDESDAQFVKPLMRLLRELARRHGCTIILLGHVPKGPVDDTVGPTMRGSGAWIANSRAAYALWPPEPNTAAKIGRTLGCPASDLVFGMLTKANHAGAPVGRRRVFRRSADGRLLDVTRALAGDAMSEAEQMNELVGACAEAAAAGKPFQKTGIGGLYADRADLPPCLAGLSRQRLEDLAQAALDIGRLVRSSTTATGSTKWLDVPDGPLARGHLLPSGSGSRRDAIARHTGTPA